MNHTTLANLVNRLESHMANSKVHLLIKEAIDTIINQQKRIQDLESIVNLMDGGLCNYINGCDDPYEPVSKWDDESKRNFDELVRVYNEWHSKSNDIGKISMDRYIENQEIMRKHVIYSLKNAIHTTKANKDAQDIIERVIRRYEDNMWGV